MYNSWSGPCDWPNLLPRISGKLVVNSERHIKAWSEVTEAIYRVGFGNEGSSLMPHSRSFFHENPASRTYFIAIPNIIFFPNPHPCPNLGEFGFPGAVKSAYSVNVYPNPVMYFVKSRNPEVPYQTLNEEFNSTYWC